MRKQIGNSMIGGSDTEVKVFEMQRAKRKELQEGDVELKIRRILIAPLVFLQMGGLSEIQAKIIYGSLIAVAGYFAYKKFKK
mgnify:CR=1 FL=1|tara:strand:- start:390 stop:635 length:246 start_codon:yes stop_codon:yes gene_type:complete